MLQVHQVKLNVEEDVNQIPLKIEEMFRLESDQILSWKIVKESIDARKKRDIKKVYTVHIELDDEEKVVQLSNGKAEYVVEKPYILPVPGKEKLQNRPVIIGFGPCGIFSALILAKMGYAPLVLERGASIEQRVKDVQMFWETGVLNPRSNVQFGEGGAGTFSDGKLNTGIKDIRIGEVLSELVGAGAPEDILYKQRPHMGTDLLRQVVINLRKKIENLGGEIRFSACLTDIEVEYDQLKKIQINETEWIPAENLILAVGHSARDTFQLLFNKKIEMKPKPFSIGLRIEHTQKIINQSQYGDEKLSEILGAADYRLSYRCQNGRGVYTFCMCPGGQVVASASETGSLVTNGMSYHQRDGENANSAILAEVTPQDFSSSHPLAGVFFQKQWEEAAFKLGGSNYHAPIQKVGDFLQGIVTQDNCDGVKPTYRPGVTYGDLTQCLPDFAVKAIQEAIPRFGRQLKGFDQPDAILTGVETRSSSPIRIERNELLQSSIRGIYPAGEGAGYAGGIISAAVDGLRVAERIIEQYAPLVGKE